MLEPVSWLWGEDKDGAEEKEGMGEVAWLRDKKEEGIFVADGNGNQSQR